MKKVEECSVVQDECNRLLLPALEQLQDDMRQMKEGQSRYINDMAMIRLLVRDADVLAVLPKAVVRDEIEAGVLRECAAHPGIYKFFYAIGVQRQFTPPLLKELPARSEDEVLNAFGRPVS